MTIDGFFHPPRYHISCADDDNAVGPSPGRSLYDMFMCTWRKGGRGPLEPPPRESTFWVRAGRTRSRRPRPGRGRRRSSTWPCAGGRDATHVLAAVNLFHPTTSRTRRCEMEVSTGEGADLVQMPPSSTVSCHRPQPPPPCLHHVLECQGRPCCRPPGA